MKIALISTVFNEGDEIFAWAKSLRAQTRLPDEFVIVDGGSTDGTPEKLRAAFSHGDFPAPKIIVEKCNIARGRNIAIENTTAEIIAATDAGSFAEKNWLQEITQPFAAEKNLDVVAGQSQKLFENEFQKFTEQFETQPAPSARAEEIAPSARNVAFRRDAWRAIGGYPEWLTLTGEDALFNFQLHKLGKRFFFNPNAIVHWPVRPNAEAYFKMYRSYGFGAAEAHLFTKIYLRQWLIVIFPFLLLLSRHRFRHLKFRYQKNAASAVGWMAGRWRGHKIPPQWKKMDGVLMSPRAQAHFCRAQNF